MPRHPGRRRHVLRWGVCALLGSWWFAAGASGQSENPVFADDSLLARDTLDATAGLVAAGNTAEAVRQLQALLLGEADRMLAVAGDEGLFRSVRAAVHERLLSEPELLERYREAEGPAAAAALARGEHDAVERSWFLTRAGFEATLRVARDHFESARFESARLALEPLALHPDRSDPRLVALAYEAWVRVWSVLPRESVARAARAWGTGELPTPIEWPASALDRARRASGQADPLEPEALVARPLRSVEIRLGVELAREQDAVHPWVEPVVAEDLLFVNDGRSVVARDRFTLSAAWRTEFEAPGVNAPGDVITPLGRQGLDECLTVTLAGRMVLAVTGMPMTTEGDRVGDGRLHAMERDTGRVLWSISPNDGPVEIRGAAFRAPVRVEGDRGVIVARQSNPTRRTGTSYLVGLDLRQGRITWVRLIASAGSVGYQRDEWPGDWPTVHEGVVYAPDRVGAVAAVELASGRPRWTRLLPTASVRRRVGSAMPWAVNVPVLTAEGLFTIAPDREAVVQIDPADGGLLGRRPAADLGYPLYLLAVGDRLAAVGRDAVGFVSRGGFATAAASITRALSEDGLVGRAVVSGGSVAVPTARGVTLVDGAMPEQTRAVRLDRSGGMLPLRSQLISYDSMELHSYLVWETAAALLDARMRERPDDPDPAITMAELAHRAGQHERLLDGVDRALDVVAPPGVGLDQPPDRARLFQAVRFVIESGGRAWLAESGPGRLLEQTETPPIESIGLLEALLERLDRVADTPEQRVVFLMLRGRMDEATGAHAAAAERYQTVVGTPALARVTWQSAELSVGAAREATRRLMDVMSAHGVIIYGPFEAQADHEFERAEQAAADAQEIERVARRFPVSGAAARAWLRAAHLHEQAGRAIDAQAALISGLEVVRARHAGGAPPQPAIDAELTGRAVSLLLRDGRLASAQRELDRFLERSPGAAPMVEGVALDATALAADLSGRLAAGRRLAVLGTGFGSDVQTLRGWTLVTPLAQHLRDAARDTVIVRDAGGSTMALFGPGAGGRLEARWSRRFESTPELVAHDAEGVYIFLDGAPGSRTLQRLDPRDGRTLWQTPGLLGLIGHDAPQRAVETPLDGWRRSDDLLLAMDGQFGVISSRTGRAAGLDLREGRVLWRAQFPPDRLADLDARDGLVAVAGERTRPGQPPTTPGDPVLALVDGATGRVVSQVTDAGGRIRWARLVRGDRLLAGFDASVVAMTAPEGQVAWVVRDHLLHESLGAWVVGPHAAVLTREGRIVLASLESGRFGAAALEAPQRDARPGTLARLVADGERLVVAAEAGVMVFDHDGLLIGADGLPKTARLLPPAVGAGAVFCAETDTAELTADGRGVFRVHLIGTESGSLLDSERLVLPSPPELAAVADGFALLTAGGSTYVLPVR